MPRQWLFEGTSVRSTRSAINADRKFANRIEQEWSVATKSQQRIVWDRTLTLSKTLRYGNSDPFNSYATPIGALDNFYIQYYRNDVLPQLYTIQHRKWISTLVSADWRICLTCFESEAAMYAILARISAIFSITSRGSHSSNHLSVFQYQASAQAALRKQLILLSKNNVQSDDNLLSCVWASCFLGATELLLNMPNARPHLEASRELIALYLQGKGQRLSQVDLLFFIYTDFQRACITLSRPLFSILTWFPWLQSTGIDCWHVPAEAYDTSIHPEVDDPVLRAMISIKREGQYVHRDFEGQSVKEKDMDLVSFVLHGRNLLFQEKVLTVALDALQELSTIDAANSASEKIRARALIALAILHWGRFASQFHVASHLLYDDAPLLIPKLRLLLLQQQESEAFTASEPSMHPDAHARLWILFVGAQAEENRANVLGLSRLFGDWFLDNFHSQALALGINSWQEAVPILEEFLYRDDLQPHISEWWGRVCNALRFG